MTLAQGQKILKGLLGPKAEKVMQEYGLTLRRNPTTRSLKPSLTFCSQPAKKAIDALAKHVPVFAYRSYDPNAPESHVHALYSKSEQATTPIWRICSNGMTSRERTPSSRRSSRRWRCRLVAILASSRRRGTQMAATFRTGRRRALARSSVWNRRASAGCEASRSHLP